MSVCLCFEKKRVRNALLLKLMVMHFVLCLRTYAVLHCIVAHRDQREDRDQLQVQQALQCAASGWAPEGRNMWFLRGRESDKLPSWWQQRRRGIPIARCC